MPASGKKTNKHSNNAGINGITFQVGVAIAAFSRNINKIDKIGLEGEEDIEIILRTGEKWFIQAKSSLKDENIEGPHNDRIASAFETLSKHNSCDEIVVATNYPAPFKSNYDYFRPIGTFATLAFSELTVTSRKELERQCEKLNITLNTENLYFWYLYWRGSEKDMTLVEYLKYYLPPELSSNNSSVMNCEAHLKNLFFENATSETDYVTRDDLKGVMLISFAGDRLDDNAISSFGYKNLEYLELVRNRFATLSDSIGAPNSFDFEYYTDIIYCYREFKRVNGSHNDDFLDEFYDKYGTSLKVTEFVKDIFADEDDSEKPEILEAAVKYIICFALAKSIYIKSISGVFENEN